MKTRMRLWLSGILVFCFSAHGIIRTAYSQDRAITKQIELLKDDDRNVRAEAANSLVKLGPVVVRPLMDALKSENTNLRREAVAALGHIRDASAIYSLIAALKDKDAVV